MFIMVSGWMANEGNERPLTKLVFDVVRYLSRLGELFGRIVQGNTPWISTRQLVPSPLTGRTKSGRVLFFRAHVASQAVLHTSTI